jgi:hypothetical protein
MSQNWSAGQRRWGTGAGPNPFDLWILPIFLDFYSRFETHRLLLTVEELGIALLSRLWAW